MKKYLHEKVGNVPLYDGKIVVILSNSKKKIRKILPEFDESPFAHCWFADYKGFKGYYIILNFDYRNKGISPGVIAHEAIHATHMIAEQRGFVPDFRNDEPIAYLAEYIVDFVTKFAKKKGFKI